MTWHGVVSPGSGIKRNERSRIALGDDVITVTGISTTTVSTVDIVPLLIS